MINKIPLQTPEWHRRLPLQKYDDCSRRPFLCCKGEVQCAVDHGGSFFPVPEISYMIGSSDNFTISFLFGTEGHTKFSIRPIPKVGNFKSTNFFYKNGVICIRINKQTQFREKKFRIIVTENS